MYNLLNIHNIQSYEHYLNEVDEIKVNKFIRREDKLRAIGSIILQKEYIISKYPQDLKEIIIKYTEFGKPFYKNLNYNVSHDADIVIIVYSNKHIGVDIMKMKPVPIYKFNDCFTIREKQYLTPLNFLSYWCAKEAFLKALGQGLSVEMSSIEFIKDHIVYEGNEYKVEFIEIPFYVCIFVEL
jgi:4'-phosphopantetheinyl transferase